MASLSNGVESWMLMALIHKDIDDFDYKNALALSERLFAIDNDNQEYRFIYAKCHYMLKDYNAAYDLLKATNSIPCRHLFARSCLELGNLMDKASKSTFYWRSGIQSLQEALDDYSKLNHDHNWADDLTCVATRSHTPSQSSIRNLLGELYIKMDNMHGSANELLQCLAENPFKLTAYINSCNIAPDAGFHDSALSPINIFKEFDLETTQLERSSKLDLPPMPSARTPSAFQPKYTTTAATVPSVPAITHQSSASASASALELAAAYGSTSILDQGEPPVLFPPQTDTPHSDTPAPSSQDDKAPRLDYLMPMIRSSNGGVSLDQLRALVKSSIEMHPEMPSWDGEPERGEIEKKKDDILKFLANDIEKQKAEEAFKNKHGLHKKPPTEVVHDFTMGGKDDNDDETDTGNDAMDPQVASPPRLDSPSISDTFRSHPAPGVPSTIKNRLRTKRARDQTFESKKKQRITSPFPSNENSSQRQQQPMTSTDSYFVPWLSKSTITPPDHQTPQPSKRLSLGRTTMGTTTTELTTKAAKEAADQTIIDAMNRIIRIMLIIANGHYYQSQYYCRETALELQKLDNTQYDTPSVLCLMGRAYYDAGDHAGARIFYRRSFFIAPWYCKGVPLYSTCLWYLEKERELCLLAKVMKDNHSHRYEAYIAAGNWTKCSNRGNEAARWFQKAVDLDPSRSYGHALLGYEEWEKGNCLGAKQHFAQCMITNKRSYFGWYGSASAYQGMHEFQQARRLIEEAIRLHPRHPVLLGTMAEILLSLKECDLALKYVEKSLAIRDNMSIQELRKKIKRQLEFGDTEVSL